jgi:hypothetical protein
MAVIIEVIQAMLLHVSANSALSAMSKSDSDDVAETEAKKQSLSNHSLDEDIHDD